jgi:DNA-binding GntR family transcriptional regulator
MAKSITDYIRRDLRARLRTEHDAPVDLTLSALSQEYRVSLTPVRLAVRDLVAEHWLVKRPNGQVAINHERKRTPTSGDSIEPPNLPLDLGNLESTFTSEVIRMSLRRETDYLREEATAERLGVGRSVLRQLLHRLQGKGLVEHLPRRGWRVRPFDEGDMLAFLDVRVSLELKALELAKPNFVRADLEAMLHGNRASAEPRLDNNLHRYIIEKAGNFYIRDFFDRHGIYFAVLFEYAAPEASVTAVMAKQHRKILRALIAGDWPSARKALAHHIRSQRPALRRFLRRIGASFEAREEPTKV